MSNRGNPSTSTEASCYVQQDVNDAESNLICRTNAYLFEGNLRTLKTRQPFEIKRRGGFPKWFDVSTT